MPADHVQAKALRADGEGGVVGVTFPNAAANTQRFLTDVIADLGIAPTAAVEEALERSRSSGVPPERILLEDGTINGDGLARARAERYGLEHLDLNVYQIDPGAANLLSPEVARRYEATPVAFVDDGALLVAMADPANVLAVDDIAIITGREIRVAVAAADDIQALVSRLGDLDDAVAQTVAEEEEDATETVDLRESSDDAPVVRLVNQIVEQGVERGASDIHLAPEQGEIRVRLRVDGVLQDVTTVSRRMAPAIISRIKIMADMDISEKRLPQDGRIGLKLRDHSVDLRIVTLPSVDGEGLVMRVLDKSSVAVDLDRLGMSDGERVRFEEALRRTHGAILVTGPTGSGKSTTLYGALKLLNTPEKNIITVEDPVEYEMPGLTQVQVSSKTGLTFAQGLRAMVRADPDVIMVGEIRDRETASIAVESALTGHLVLSTLHTNDAPGAITRLVEMGVEPFLIASALDCVVGQRLVRTLCSNCKQRTIIPAQALRASGYNAQVDVEAYEPVGCRRCAGSGYKGRIGLYEVMGMSPEIAQLALERAPAEKIRDVAVAQGMIRMREDGLEKVRQGRTSISEVTRVLGA